MEERIKRLEEKFLKIIEQKDEVIARLEKELSELKETYGVENDSDKQSEELLQRIKA